MSEVRLDGAKSSGANGNDSDKSNKNKENLKATKLPPCAACRVLIESFTKVSRESVIYMLN